LKAPALLTCAVAAAVCAEILVPGRLVYHAGWFNVGLAALTWGAVVSARRRLRTLRTASGKAGLVALAFGAAVLGFAGVASGLLAPDNRTVVGAPGERVWLGDFGGELDFPLVQSPRALADDTVRYVAGARSIAIGTGWRDLGSAIARAVARRVVSVDVRDPRGGHLTVTQPAGSVFLSPVLLMQHRQAIAGMDLPFDSFAVPAAHRIVKAVLFSPAQAAGLRGALPGLPAVLFAVDDQDDRPLPGAIALAEDGQSIRLGGLLLRPDVLEYPAVEMVAAPSLAAVVIGIALAFAGGLAVAADRRRERSRS
jgi:hypothetical protein